MGEEEVLKDRPKTTSMVSEELGTPVGWGRLSVDDILFARFLLLHHLGDDIRLPRTAVMLKTCEAREKLHHIAPESFRHDQSDVKQLSVTPSTVVRT